VSAWSRRVSRLSWKMAESTGTEGANVHKCADLKYFVSSNHPGDCRAGSALLKHPAQADSGAAALYTPRHGEHSSSTLKRSRPSKRMEQDLSKRF
jgi:hypothetical protein